MRWVAEAARVVASLPPRKLGPYVAVADQVVDPVDLLEDLRRAGVRRVDRLVVGGRTATEVERVVRHRWPVSEVVVQR